MPERLMSLINSDLLWVLPSALSCSKAARTGKCRQTLFLPGDDLVFDLVVDRGRKDLFVEEFVLPSVRASFDDLVAIGLADAGKRAQFIGARRIDVYEGGRRGFAWPQPWRGPLRELSPAARPSVRPPSESEVRVGSVSCAMSFLGAMVRVFLSVRQVRGEPPPDSFREPALDFREPTLNRQCRRGRRQ